MYSHMLWCFMDLQDVVTWSTVTGCTTPPWTSTRLIHFHMLEIISLLSMENMYSVISLKPRKLKPCGFLLENKQNVWFNKSNKCASWIHWFPHKNIIRLQSPNDQCNHVKLTSQTRATVWSDTTHTQDTLCMFPFYDSYTNSNNCSRTK